MSHRRPFETLDGRRGHEAQGRLAPFASFLFLSILADSCHLCIQWLTENRTETEASHDLSLGLRENYRKRWKTAINAVRASTKFRTFAALAADGKTGPSESGEGAGAAAADGEEEGRISPPTKSELYSESSSRDGEVEDADYLTGDEGEDARSSPGQANGDAKDVGESGVKGLVNKLQGAKVSS